MVSESRRFRRCERICHVCGFDCRLASFGMHTGFGWYHNKKQHTQTLFFFNSILYHFLLLIMHSYIFPSKFLRIFHKLMHHSHSCLSIIGTNRIVKMKIKKAKSYLSSNKHYCRLYLDNLVELPLASLRSVFRDFFFSFFGTVTPHFEVCFLQQGALHLRHIRCFHVLNRN